MNDDGPISHSQTQTKQNEKARKGRSIYHPGIFQLTGQLWSPVGYYPEMLKGTVCLQYIFVVVFSLPSLNNSECLNVQMQRSLFCGRAGQEDREDFSEPLPLLQLTGQMPPAQEGRFDENDEVGSYWQEILGRFIAYILCRSQMAVGCLGW